ncbi:MAG: putative ABC transporter permease [Roseburia sp.]|nr:putative ABC transporter permease [Roseburia sp.]
MIYTGYELLWLFFAYAFLGWVLETITAAAKQRRFVNRGLINGPVCVIYGIGACLITVSLQELSGFWLLLGSGILATVIEWIAGHLIERFYHEKWWDYSKMPWNLDGYVCLPVSALWGVLGFIVVKWGNAPLLRLFHLCPALPGKLILWIFTGLLVLDVVASLIIMSGRSRRIERWQAADAWINGISSRLGKWIYGHVDARVRRAYPKAQKKDREEQAVGVFAAGCGFYKIVALFFIGAFLGDVVETIFCRITAGVWMSRSSVVWGPFSIVWGLGIAGATALLYKYKDRSEHFLFLMGTFLGGAYEYVCSVFTELVFGTVFWDYSELPLNLGGRINLLYCFFWGIAAVVWFKFFYPKVSGLIERIPMRLGKAATWILLIFMICNVLVSCMALTRYDERSSGIPATTTWQQTIDERFPDERMERIYPDALKVE